MESRGRKENEEKSGIGLEGKSEVIRGGNIKQLWKVR